MEGKERKVGGEVREGKEWCVWKLKRRVRGVGREVGKGKEREVGSESWLASVGWSKGK